MSKEKTFHFDDNLPNLKVPDLHVTIQKYLDSVKAVATDEEFSQTFRFCQDFLQNQAPILQKKLKEREQNNRNWVEEIWLDKAYLETRLPLTHCNFSGVCSLDEIWPPQQNSQIYRSSFSLHLLASFWKDVRDENITPHKNSRNQPFSMDQMKYCYNMSRVPQKKKDKLVSHFRLAKEGSAPTHSIVCCRGKLFKIQLFDHQGNVHTAPQIEASLGKIVEICRNEEKKSGDDVACMTSLDRDEWCDMRDYLMTINQDNERSLKEIESAIHVLCLDDTATQTHTATMMNSMCGDSSIKWRDKSYNEVWTSDGLYAAHCDHTPIDGMIFVVYIEYMLNSLKKCDGKWENYRPRHQLSAEPCDFERIEFEIDDVIRGAIEKGRMMSAKFGDEIEVQVPSFSGFGKDDLKKLKVHPDGFIQIALQLAYMRMYKRPAATYETATARRYFHGRTETCRTCTPELVDFCTSVINCDGDVTHDDVIYDKLMSAHDKFMWVSKECSINRGCDRHLFGLQITAMEQGMEMPRIFTDDMYTKTGGNGNFILSTSFVGFFNATGAVAPMRMDGYGFFYRVNQSSINYSLLSWKQCTTTSVEQFRPFLHQSFHDVYQIFATNRHVKSHI